MSHKAIVAVVTDVIAIPKADKIQVGVVLGENVIISKDIKPGYVGVLFPEGLQLSEEFCKENNLHRHAHLNKDSTKTGFFDDNRKVRAQPFLGVKSTAYFADLNCLAYLPDEVSLCLKLGDSFDELAGHPICCKYVSQATRDKINNANRPKQAKKDFAPFFAKHVDSEQFKHNVGLIPKGSLIHFHAKVHGTSHRSALTKVSLALPWWKRTLNKAVPNMFPDWKWDFVVGTRNVVLTPGKEGFHGSEQFRFDVAEMLKPHMQKGMCCYGEIAGFANGKPIMAVHNGKDTKNKEFVKKYGEQIVYKYGCKEHEYRFHIYRITYLNHEGVNVDFTQAQLDQWCKDRQLLGPISVRDPIVYDGDAELLSHVVEQLTERPDVLGEDVIDPSHPYEGVILRIDTGKYNPMFMKSKSTYFRIMEGMVEAEDTEDAA